MRPIQKLACLVLLAAGCTTEPPPGPAQPEQIPGEPVLAVPGSRPPPPPEFAPPVEERDAGPPREEPQDN